MPKKSERLTFVSVRKFANENNFSMDRHPLKGFYVWRVGNTAEKFSNPVQPTLQDAQNFIQSELDKGESRDDWNSAS